MKNCEKSIFCIIYFKFEIVVDDIPPYIAFPSDFRDLLHIGSNHSF